MEYERWQHWDNKWTPIFGGVIKAFRRAYPRVKTRIKPIYPILEIAASVNMISKFLITT